MIHSKCPICGNLNPWSFPDNGHERCYHCGYELSRIQVPIPNVQFATFQEIMQHIRKDPESLLTRDLDWISRRFSVRQLINGTSDQLVKLDESVFLKGNQYGQSMIDLANNLPDSVLVLYENNQKIRGYLDLFFFEPNTFCNRTSLQNKIMIGHLPEAGEILNSTSLISTPKKGDIVDVYIDAFCIDSEGGFKEEYAKMLLSLTAQKVLDDSILKTIRINQIATVSVQNNQKPIILNIGQQTNFVDPGDNYALKAGLSHEVDGIDPQNNLYRSLYYRNFEKGPILLTAQSCLLATRAVRYILPYVGGSWALYNIVHTLLHV